MIDEKDLRDVADKLAALKVDPQDRDKVYLLTKLKGIFPKLVEAYLSQPATDPKTAEQLEALKAGVREALTVVNHPAVESLRYLVEEDTRLELVKQPPEVIELVRNAKALLQQGTMDEATVEGLKQTVSRFK